MEEIYQHAVTVFMGFFAIMNPVANTAVFAGLVGDRSKSAQIHTAAKGLIVAFCVVSVFALLGKTIFQLFGISLPALRIAGGVLVFMIGYEMLHGRKSKVHHPEDLDRVPRGEEESSTDVSVSPLALPILAGPGTLATAMNFSASGGWEKIGITIGAFAVLCVITFFCFVVGQKAIRFIGESGVQIVTRIMGLIMAVIGVQMLIDGMRGAIGVIG
ncbi:MAG: MarC family protein [Planctomycetota bacterium]